MYVEALSELGNEFNKHQQYHYFCSVNFPLLIGEKVGKSKILSKIYVIIPKVFHDVSMTDLIYLNNDD